MAINFLLNIPKDKDGWDTWSWAHRQHHDAIREAIQQQSNGADNLAQYQLDPLPADDVTGWLSRNQQSHDDMNEVLQLQGTDLEGVNFKDSKQLEAWIYSHFLEHQSAAAQLAI